jgi:hypothetical protein
MLRRGKVRCARSVAIGVGLLFGAAGMSWAEENIGGAKVVINNVQGNLPTGADVAVVQGDNVFLNEAVHSGEDSKARLLLKDNTDVSIGPGSTVKLDEFVYSGPKSAGTIGLNMTKGTLRFVTGDASKRAYTIWTPTAAIGVRGTILRVKITEIEDPQTNVVSYKTSIINEEGKAIVCHRAAGDYSTVEQIRQRRCPAALPTHKGAAGTTYGGCGCQELLVPGQEATVTNNQIAITEAPVDAITEPIIGETVGLAGIPLAAVAVVGLAAVAGVVGVVESNNSSGSNGNMSP